MGVKLFKEVEPSRGDAPQGPQETQFWRQKAKTLELRRLAGYGEPDSGAL